ncbi:putative phospholipase C [Dacryopinax primogenitus]|uniref:Putative phospholipase C n=1 Tax=Dacryopinax primogenitus (strain DJM 731) TaxID=1858805 RepID=M5FS97_DACPD|nr:putative phospholipase C [Dacryopinax primogenitus]EJT98678.1 putative phospholipase C [Dacryopinax primogenitus]
MLAFATFALSLIGTAFAQAATSLADIEHVVFFMQENRAFDHYFGTLYGVRGFQDPNAQINADGKSVFYQKVNSSLSNATDYLLPWYINYQGGDYLNGTQCMDGGSNSFENNHAAYANGTNDMWALDNNPASIAYFKRQDLPIHYAIADAWTIGDMYQEAQMASTWPNRVHWITGTVNIPGGPTNSTQGPVLDNNDTPGSCSHLTFTNFITDKTYETTTNVSCFPYDWVTVPEILQDLGVSWFVYQADDNFGCNELAAFKTFIEGAASPLNDTDNPLIVNGMTYSWSDNNDWQGGFTRFKNDAMSGNLPQVSWVIPTTELSEHPPYTPRQGAWLQQEIINAIQKSPIYNKTVLFISYDETGGWADHVLPFHSPAGTPGEWITDPLAGLSTFAGPGFRLPFYAISPYSRGGNVFTEVSDHTSQLLFLEKWAAARGTPFTTEAISSWRRTHMSDLTGMFDFTTFNSTPVVLPQGELPFTDGLTGLLAGAEYCQAKYEGNVNAHVPYGLQSETEALAVESGFRSVRGSVTEGRYLVFESAGVALAAADGLGVAAPLAQKETDATQRFVIHASNPLDADATVFSISSNGNYINAQLELDSAANAAVWNITFSASTMSYNIQDTNSGQYLSLTSAKPVLGSTAAPFKIYSVTF